jgi:nucleoside-diphosphate-sugar epimerase
VEPPPDEYALSKRLGEVVCRLHPAPATVVRFTSVFGPGQVAREGATGAIAWFAAKALGGEPIVIPGDPERARDFVYVDDAVAALAGIAAGNRWNETVTVASGVATPLIRAAELVAAAVGNSVPIETTGGELPPGENESYEAAAALDFSVRPLEEAIPVYVDWLRTATQSRPGT